MNTYWSDSIALHSDHCDSLKRCRLSSLLGWMQRAADADIARLGIPIEELMEQEMAWMLTTLDLELDRMPRYGDVLRIETWHKGEKGVQWLRDFRIYDENEAIIGQARTTWVLVNLAKRRILRASALPYEVPATSGESLGDIPAKVQIPEQMKLNEAFTYTVRHHDMDMNGHMNNTIFASLSLDTLEDEPYRAELSRFRITYHQEAKLRDVFSIYQSYDEANKQCWVRGRSSEGMIHFEAELTLRS
ncbi:acyl-[acyl-carrier-protein] thioesterase [Paenibacillus sp. 1001270B_150601_E10]|uniref:acyl-[acyl-carrier-protein] thioesterase n=1 Tax=Paenibacillus sp. 1001270B_150601_E10 TaxID=2787079 RepID=UPI0018A0EC1E|nr:acyl-ACP thioesterase domain-containing protein [Paenibacillus sp. 1001270B_150601_E10]